MLIKNDIILLPIEKRHLDATRCWANSLQIQNSILRTFPVYDENQNKWYTEIVESNSKIVFAIEVPNKNKHIGNTGFYNIDHLHRRAEFWILIGNKDFRGQGLGKQVVSLMLTYGFSSLNLNKIYLHVLKENKQAINLYKKFNFREEGLLKQHFYINGSYKDISLMSLLHTEQHGKNNTSKS